MRIHPLPSEQLDDERRGYPRPQLRRKFRLSLNGNWEFAVDTTGIAQGPDEVRWTDTIRVPFSPGTPAQSREASRTGNSSRTRSAIRAPRVCGRPSGSKPFPPRVSAAWRSRHISHAGKSASSSGWKASAAPISGFRCSCSAGTGRAADSYQSWTVKSRGIVLSDPGTLKSRIYRSHFSSRSVIRSPLVLVPARWRPDADAVALLHCSF